jgi:UDP-N-acetylenolpyruvoylglucosamine reductase
MQCTQCQYWFIFNSITVFSNPLISGEAKRVANAHCKISYKRSDVQHNMAYLLEVRNMEAEKQPTPNNRGGVTIRDVCRFQPLLWIN